MATILDPITSAIHDTATTLISQQVPTKLAGAVNGLVSAGFDTITQVLTVVQNLTAPPPAPPSPPPGP